MALFRRLAILSFFLITAMPQGHAQVGLQNNASLTLYGFTFTVSGCTWGANSTSSSGGGCSGDNLVLQSVADAHGYIDLQVANVSAGSAALSQNLNGRNSYLSFTLTAVPVGNSKNTVSAATLTGVGIDSWNTSGCFSNCTPTVTSNVTSSGTTILSVPWAEAWNTTKTWNSTPYTLSSPVNSFSITENVALNSNGVTNGSALQLNTLTLRMSTVPEPASLAVLVLGAGGLAMARRRRRKSA